MQKEFLVCVGNVVVSHSDRLDLRRQGFERRKVGALGVGYTELIVEDSAGRMDMRLPSVPLRTATDHFHLQILILTTSIGKV